MHGLGAGTVLLVADTVLTQAAGPDRLGRVTAAVSIPAQVTPIVGPLVGGLIVDTVSWRWCFSVNVPICLRALLLAWRLVPDTPGEPSQRLALLAPGLGALTYGLSRAGAVGFSRREVAATLAVGAALMVGFAVHALRTPTVPLIDLRLFAHRAFAAAGGMLVRLGASLFGSVVIVPLYFQQIRGATALTAGLLLAPQFAGTLLALPFVGRVADRVAGGGLVLGGAAVAALVTLLFTQVGRDPAPAVLRAAMFLRGVGFGVASITLVTVAYRGVSADRIPRATSTLQIGQRLGPPLGAAVLTAVLQNQLSACAAGPSAGVTAYGITFWWSLALTAPALVPALLLGRARASR